MSRYLHLARPRGLVTSAPLRGPSLASQKAQRRGLSPRAAAELLRYDWAHPEPGIDQDEFFDDQFERRAHEIQRTPSGENAVSIVPQKRGPWSGNNQLGIEREFAPDDNNRQTILRLDEWGFPDIWTVTLGLNDFTRTAGGFDVTAVLEFGSGGATQYLEMDWLCGSSITLPMNALNLVAQYNLIDGEVAGEVPDDLRLRVTISKMPSRNSNPTRSYLFTDAVSSFIIPPFAKAMHISPLNTGDPFDFYAQRVKAVFTTRGLGLATGSINSYQFAQFVSYIDFINEYVGGPMFLPIPPYARAVDLQTIPAGAASNQTLVAQFLIGL